MFCKKCGATVSTKYCPHCGTKAQTISRMERLRKDRVKREFVNQLFKQTGCLQTVRLNAAAWDIAENFFIKDTGNQFMFGDDLCPEWAAEAILSEAKYIRKVLVNAYFERKDNRSVFSKGGRFYERTKGI